MPQTHMKDFFGKDCSPLKHKKLWLFDMDGTIYRENTLFGGVPRLLSAIAERGGKYVFVTNNSSLSVDDYVAKLARLGITAEEDNFFTSSQATALMLAENFKGKTVYAQGTRSFVKELCQSGVAVTEQYDESVSAIVVGFDSELTAAKMRTTCKMLTNLKKVPYFAANPDWVYPVDFGYVPDCGSMCFGYEKATGRTPVFIGKPRPDMIRISMQRHGATAQQTVVLGDRLYTDIASGVNAGVDTVLVLSGEATLADLETSDVKPAFVLETVSALADLFA